MGDKIVKSKNLCCRPVVFPSLSLLSLITLTFLSLSPECFKTLKLFLIKFPSHLIINNSYTYKSLFDFKKTYPRPLIIVSLAFKTVSFFLNNFVHLIAFDMLAHKHRGIKNLDFLSGIITDRNILEDSY